MVGRDCHKARAKKEVDPGLKSKGWARSKAHP
jgi:hypothetical protein